MLIKRIEYLEKPSATKEHKVSDADKKGQKQTQQNKKDFFAAARVQYGFSWEHRKGRLVEKGAFLTNKKIKGCNATQKNDLASNRREEKF